MPARPIERRNGSGNTVRPASATATVNPENRTVRPAVPDARSTAGPTCGVDRAFLAEPVDDQQRVVDGEADREHRHDLDRVDGDVGHLAEREKDAERAGHAGDRDDQRQPGGDQAAEDEQQQDEYDGRGDDLGAGHVARGLVVELGLGHRTAGDGDGAAGHVGAQRADPARGVGGHLLGAVTRRQADREQQRPAGLGRRQWWAHLGDAGHRPHVGADPFDRGEHRGIGRVHAGDDGGDGLRLGRDRVAQVAGAVGLAAGHHPDVTDEAFEDADADGEAGTDDGQPDHEHEDRAAYGEACE